MQHLFAQQAAVILSCSLCVKNSFSTINLLVKRSCLKHPSKHDTISTAKVGCTILKCDFCNVKVFPTIDLAAFTGIGLF